MVSEIQRLMDGESEMNREKWGISMDTQNLVNLSEKPNHHIIIINLHEIKKHLILRIIHNVRVEERDEYIWDMSKIKSS